MTRQGRRWAVGASTLLFMLMGSGVSADEFADVDPMVLAKGIEHLAAAWTIPMSVADTSEREIEFLDRHAETPVAFPMLKPTPELPYPWYRSITTYGLSNRDLGIYPDDLFARLRREGVLGGVFRRRFR